MSYEKQYFEDGAVLTADHLNHIEDGIAAQDMNSDKLDSIQNTLYEVSSKIDNISNGGGGGSANLGEISFGTNGTFYASDHGFDGFSVVEVDVQGGGGGSVDDYINNGLGSGFEGTMEYDYYGDYIANGVFAGNLYLEAISCVNTSEVRPCAFAYCGNLHGLWSTNLRTVKSHAFRGTKIPFITASYNDFDRWEADKQGFCSDGLSEIGDFAFAECECLTSVSLYINPRGYTVATLLGKSAFENCIALETFDFQLGGYESIKPKTFAGCTNLKALVLREKENEGGDPVYMDDETALEGTAIANGTGYIYVPASLVDTYKLTPCWLPYENQFRALEDYTIDGTASGELNMDLINSQE